MLISCFPHCETGHNYCISGSIWTPNLILRDYIYWIVGIYLWNNKWESDKYMKQIFLDWLIQFNCQTMNWLPNIPSRFWTNIWSKCRIIVSLARIIVVLLVSYSIKLLQSPKPFKLLTTLRWKTFLVGVGQYAKSFHPTARNCWYIYYWFVVPCIHVFLCTEH